MPLLVPDASVLAVALVDNGPAGGTARRRLLGNRLSAPELVDLEVTAVVRKQVLHGDLRADRATQAVEDLARMPLTRVPHRHLLDRIWQLHRNVTPYDAAYVAVAERLQATLVTADTRLAQAPRLGCQTEVLAG